MPSRFTFLWTAAVLAGGIVAIAVAGLATTRDEKTQVPQPVAEKAAGETQSPEERFAILQDRLRAAEGLTKHELGELLEEISAGLAETAPDQRIVRLATEAAVVAERHGETRWAVRVYRRLAAMFSQIPEPGAVAWGAVLEGSARRLDLPGNELILQGTTVDGQAFDWSRYRGDVVLVEFFASWCKDCRLDMPAIRENYQRYHDRGFEVVSISIDENRQDLQRYLDEAALPWTVLLDDPKAGPEKSPSAYYGVFSVPQMILVGRDGKVISLPVGAEQLDNELKNLFGFAD
jgi:thiol-disulfide isomerase/thioredoxin